MFIEFAEFIGFVGFIAFIEFGIDSLNKGVYVKIGFVNIVVNVNARAKGETSIFLLHLRSAHSRSVHLRGVGRARG